MKQQGGIWRGFTRLIATSIAAAIVQIRNAENSRAADEHMVAVATKKMAAYTALLFCATLASLASAAFTAWILWNQLGEMQTDQRAWITINSPKFTSPLVFDHNGGTVWFTLHLKNIGKTPARYVLAKPDFFARDLTNASVRVENENCDRMAARPTDENGEGFNIFPGDELDLPVEAVMKPAEVEKLATVTQARKGTAVIAGCVDYLSGDLPKHGRTGFIYEVDKSGGQGAGFFINPSVDKNIPAEQLILMINPGLVPIAR